MNNYLTEDHIGQMAEAAFTTWEVSADKAAAMRAAQEYAMDELGIIPRRTAVLRAYKIAMYWWSNTVADVKRQIEA